MTFLDTNYLIRFFTCDIKTQAQKAKKIIENTDNLYISVIVAAETVYILQKHYQVDKKNIISALTNLLKQPNISAEKFVIKALEIYLENHVSFYDCLLLAEAIEKNADLVSFDQKLVKVFQKQ